MKCSYYFVFNHSGTSELNFFWTHCSSLRLTCNSPWTNSVTVIYTAAERTWTHSKHILCYRYPASLLARHLNLQKTQLPVLLRVRQCLQICCLAMHWSNPSQYDSWNGILTQLSCFWTLFIIPFKNTIIVICDISVKMTCFKFYYLAYTLFPSLLYEVLTHTILLPIWYLCTVTIWCYVDTALCT
jgi:hypothetical protein